MARSQIDRAIEEHDLTAIAGLAESHKLAFVAGYPQLTTPAGFWPDDTKTRLIKDINPTSTRYAGRPIGLTLAGRDTAALLQIANLYELATWMRFASKPNAFDDQALADL